MPLYLPMLKVNGRGRQIVKRVISLIVSLVKLIACRRSDLLLRLTPSVNACDALSRKWWLKDVTVSYFHSDAPIFATDGSFPFGGGNSLRL